MATTSYRNSERGAALLTAMIFLIIITLLAISAMRSSTLELTMAGNEQVMTAGQQCAQSAIDAVMNPINFPVKTGYVGCYNYPDPTTGCTAYLSLPAGACISNATNKIKVSLKSEGGFSCRACESSASLFDGAIFHIESLYDDTARRGGRVDVVEGFITLVPKN